MPKKFASENTKAVAARERKKATKEVETAKKKQAEEDAYWQDDNKQVLKKQQKRDEQERKRQEALQKKAEVKALLEKENATLPKQNSKPGPPPKVTRAQISATKATQQNKVEKQEKIETHLEAPLVENVNRLEVDGDEARSVTEAIAILSTNVEDVDKHPEKRMKAAYTAYEERRLIELKEEFPSLKLSQLKQRIFKEWQKSPENPINKAV